MKYSIEELMKLSDNGSKDVPIRKHNKRERFYFDNEIIERDYLKLFHNAILIYVVLAKCAHARNQGCFLTYETLMKESGISNRNTLSAGIKILTALNMIWIKNFKGTLCNFYYLIDSSLWKPADSINADTVKSVSKYPKRQYQKKPENSNKNDTLNQRLKSTYKIGRNNKINDEKDLNLNQERTPEEQEEINKQLAEMRKNLSKTLGWKTKQ